MPITRRPAARSAVALAVLLALAACGGPAGGASPGGASPVLTRPARTPSPGGAVLDQAWATAALVDVTTGETFRIADLAGTVLIIEMMAIWCTNCRAQQASVEQALAKLPQGRVVFVVLDVDPNEDGASLAQYRTSHGYTGRYAVASLEVARALAADFGDQFLNPPSTPMLVIATDGTVTQTDFGHKGADQIVTLALAGGA